MRFKRKFLETEHDYRRAKTELLLLETTFFSDIPPGSPEEREMTELRTVIEIYENEQTPFESNMSSG